jgi:hypothetical protein
MRKSNDLRRLCLHLLLAGCCSGGPAVALAQGSHVDDADDASVWFAAGTCLTAGALGFGLGAKIRLTRDIANAAT